jgi:hypothetical protein
MFIEIIIKFDYQPPLSLPLFLPLFHIHLGKLSFQNEIKYTHSHKKNHILNFNNGHPFNKIGATLTFHDTKQIFTQLEKVSNNKIS